eukprot:TRINITY_DN5611_c0_g1_i1.p1 TRINITY_DN5611_c0_g1~~TRINITY_DN5611_c0_g1_i1.p1  ORF type:complete len:1071 (+),score=248.21 TRINITY_DN5611_c0_g1_i1:382-3213(+)
MFTHRLPLVWVEMFVLGCAVCVVLSDWGQGAYQDVNAWPVGVVVMDMCLVFNVRRHVTLGALAFFTVWVLVRSAEEMWRFGVFAVPFDTEVDRPANTARGQPLTTINYIVCRLIPFVLDFSVTDGFCSNMREANERIQAAACVSQEIAVALSFFDLPKAQDHIDKSEHLPRAMREAYSRLLRNLAEYRSYLPEACLVIDDDDDLTQEGDDLSMGSGTGDSGRHSRHACLDSPSMRSNPLSPHQVGVVPASPQRSTSAAAVPPPPGDEVAIVFTDVEGSTELWDLFPVGMQRALATHNNVIRHCVDDQGGYEVKTVGDAFMIAFSDLRRAVRCALNMQTALCNAEWPSEVLGLQRCAKVLAKTGQVLWNGIRIRAGVHCGAARREMNPITGRADYFGATVNVAARTEAAARIGGVVCLTGDSLSTLRPTLADFGDPVVVDLGKVEMKGVASPPTLHALFPRQLAGRQEEFTRRWRLLRKADSSQSPTNRRRSSGATEASCMSGVSAGNFAGAAVRSRLLQGRATVGCFRVRQASQGFFGGSVLQQTVVGTICIVDNAVDRSSGVIVALNGMSVLAAWNAGGRICVQHASQVVRAVSLISRCYLSAVTMNIGAASGQVVHGRVGSGKHGFVAALGEPVELSQHLAAAAKAVGTLACAAGLDGEPCAAQDPSSKHLTRAIDVWSRVDAGPHIVVYEINPTNDGEDEDQWGLVDDDATRDPIWGSEKWTEQLVVAYGMAPATIDLSSLSSPVAPRGDVNIVLPPVQPAGDCSADPVPGEAVCSPSERIQLARRQLRQTVEGVHSLPTPQRTVDSMQLAAEAAEHVQSHSFGSTPRSVTARGEQCAGAVAVLERVLANADAGEHLHDGPIAWDFPVRETRHSDEARGMPRGSHSQVQGGGWNALLSPMSGQVSAGLRHALTGGPGGPVLSIRATSTTGSGVHQLHSFD